MLIIQTVNCLNNIDIISYNNIIEANYDFTFFIGWCLGYLSFGFFAIYINYIPLYLYDKNINDGLISHYMNILKTKNSNCIRSDYLLFFIAYIVFDSFLIVIMNFTELKEIPKIFILLAWGLHLIFKAKRLNDAGISKYFLFIYLTGLLGKSFNLVTCIVMFFILCLPSQQIHTTDIGKIESN